MTLEELTALLQSYAGNTYTPMTAEQMQEAAYNHVSSAYNQKRQSAKSAYEASDQALAQQLAGLGATYDKQREQSAKNTAQNYAAADRQAAGRGMQRSSFNNSTLANINLKGAEAQQAINDTQAAQEKNIGDQRTQLAKALAEQMATYDAAQQTDIQAYLDELEAREYERAQNALAMQIQLAQQNWQNAFQQQQANQSQSNWQAEFNAMYGGGGGSSGGSGGSSSGSGSQSGNSLWDWLGGNQNSPGTSGGSTGTVSGVNPNTTQHMKGASNKNKRRYPY